MLAHGDAWLDGVPGGDVDDGVDATDDAERDATDDAEPTASRPPTKPAPPPVKQLSLF